MDPLDTKILTAGNERDPHKEDEDQNTFHFDIYPMTEQKLFI